MQVRLFSTVSLVLAKQKFKGHIEDRHNGNPHSQDELDMSLVGIFGRRLLQLGVIDTLTL